MCSHAHLSDEHSLRNEIVQSEQFSNPRVSLVRRANEPFLPAEAGQEDIVPGAKWDSFLEGVGRELTCGFGTSS